MVALNQNGIVFSCFCWFFKGTKEVAVLYVPSKCSHRVDSVTILVFNGDTFSLRPDQKRV